MYVCMYIQKKRSQTEYVPEFRSGPYAIIIALYRAKQVINVNILRPCLTLFS